MHLVDEIVREHSDETGFPDARLAAHQHHLAVAGGGPLPPAAQERDLLVASDERRELGRVHPREPTRHAARTANAVRVDGSGQPFQGLGTKILALEEAADEPTRRAADDHGIRLGDRLQPRRHVRRLAERQALGRVPIANVAHDDEPGVNANARLHCRHPQRPSTGCVGGS